MMRIGMKQAAPYNNLIEKEMYEESEAYNGGNPLILVAKLDLKWIRRGGLPRRVQEMIL